MDADQHVAQRVGRRRQPARRLHRADAGPRAAVAGDDVAKLLVELQDTVDLPMSGYKVRILVRPEMVFRTCQGKLGNRVKRAHIYQW